MWMSFLSVLILIFKTLRFHYLKWCFLLKFDKWFWLQLLLCLDTLSQIIFKWYQNICLHIKVLMYYFMVIIRYIDSVHVIKLTLQFCNKSYFSITPYALNVIIVYTDISVIYDIGLGFNHNLFTLLYFYFFFYFAK